MVASSRTLRSGETSPITSMNCELYCAPYTKALAKQSVTTLYVSTHGERVDSHLAAIACLEHNITLVHLDDSVSTATSRPSGPSHLHKLSNEADTLVHKLRQKRLVDTRGRRGFHVVCAFPEVALGFRAKKQ